MEVPKMKRVIVCFLACAGVAVMLSACGDNGKTDSGKKSAIKETAEGADKFLLRIFQRLTFAAISSIRAMILPFSFHA